MQQLASWMTAALVTAAAPCLAADAVTVDARADALLRRMSAVVAGAARLNLEAADVRTATAPDGTQVVHRLARRLRIRRPDAFRERIQGDERNAAIWFERGALALQSDRQRAYAEARVGRTIDDAVAHLTTRLGVPMPLAPVLASSPYDRIMRGVTRGEVVGVEEIDGERCSHLTFSAGTVDRDVWIRADGPPLPCRLQTAYRTEPGVPVVQITFIDWELDARFAKDAFRFVPPEGYPRIRFAEEAVRPRSPGAVGAVARTLPFGSQTLYVHGQPYYYHQHAYYERVYHRGDVVYQVVRPPIGAVVAVIPADCPVRTEAGTEYRVCDGVHYARVDGGYQVVEVP